MSKKVVQKIPRITNITRVIVYLAAFAVFSVCAILLPEIGREEARANPNAGSVLPFIIGAWVLSVPVFMALSETLKILKYVDQNIAFSNLTVTAIRNIKKYALIFGAMVLTAAISVVIIVHNIDPSEDTPPVLMFGTVLSFTSIVIATFAATLQRLLHDALNLKEENDLTV